MYASLASMISLAELPAGPQKKMRRDLPLVSLKSDTYPFPRKQKKIAGFGQ
jgi:hypothetical protein